MDRMVYRIALVVLLTALAFFPSEFGPRDTPAALPALARSAGSMSSHRVVTSAYGFRLTLTVPRPTYSSNALARVVVRLRNVSHHSLQAAGEVLGFCQHRLAGVNVLNTADQAINPLPPPPAIPSCPFPRPYTLRPGQTITEEDRVVIMAERVQAETNVNTLSSGTGYMGAELTTPIINVRLLPDSPPRSG